MADRDTKSTPLTPSRVDTLDTGGEAVTRVNSKENKSKEDVSHSIGAEDSPVKAADGHEKVLLTGRKLVLAHLGFLLAMFCTSLDQTIVATALPKLASQFNALDQLTWVVTAYFLTQAGLMLFFGQVLTIAKAKWVYLSCIVLFEIGSLICGVAPQMNVLIFGRAFQGVGASGIYISIITVLSQITKLENRPILFGTFGAVFAIASVAGPLLGGALTDHATWRWCFYINLPFGGISIVAALLFQPSNPPPPNPLYDSKTMLQRWLALDWVGAFLSVATVVCLLLPLQWGGVTRPWNDKAVIALFVVFAALFGAFIAWEHHKGACAMMPLSFFKNRTQVGGALAIFAMMIPFLAGTYYLPFFYQAKGRTASQSGIDIIPFMLTMVFASFTSGGIVNATGHYYYILVFGPLISAVGAGLLFTIDEFMGSARLIGYQIIFGMGLGIAGQLPLMAVQAEYALLPELIAQASSLLSFLQLIGGVVGIAIAGTIFNNKLNTELSVYAPNLPPDTLEHVKQSVTVIFELEDTIKGGVIHAYVKALTWIFILCIPACVLASICGAFVRNWNFKTRGKGAAGEAPVVV